MKSFFAFFADLVGDKPENLSWEGKTAILMIVGMTVIFYAAALFQPHYVQR